MPLASGGEFLVQLEFCLLLVGELAGALDVLETLVNVYVTGCFVEKGTACVELRLHREEHFVNGREVHDFRTELLAVL